MPRIRSLHPGQWTDEAFVSCSMPARLLAIAIRNIADDNGVFCWKPITLKMQLFPADNVDVPALLAELVESGQVVAFDEGGAKYGAIRNFRRWQRPEKPKGLFPFPDRLRSYVALSATGGEAEAGESPNDAPSDGQRSATDAGSERSQSATSRRPVGESLRRREEIRRKEEGDKENPLTPTPDGAGGSKRPDGWVGQWDGLRANGTSPRTQAAKARATAPPPPEPDHPLWPAMRDRISAIAFQTTIGKLGVDRSGDRPRLIAPNAFLRDHVRANFDQALRNAFGGEFDIEVAA